MIIQRSWLRNFRNYEKAEIIWNPDMNLITGNNAQGKTNLLESIVYLSLTRSHRTSADSNMIRNGMEHAEIGCFFIDERDDSEKRLDAVIHSKGKTLLINKNNVKRSSDFVGQLNVILFSPDDLGLFNDAPKERRKVMNQEISKISSRYLGAMTRYQNLLKNRNALLKSFQPDQHYLDTLDEQMIAEESVIIQHRMKFVESMGRWIDPLYKELSMDDIDISMRYQCCIEHPEENVEEQLRKMYISCRQKDLETHSTSFGVQREDLIFEMNGRNLIQTASQGQKRMTMLSFKMALLRYIKELTDKKPVLLLDDVLSELDRTRQEKLIEMVTGPHQCIITATEVPEFIKKRNFTEFKISNGKVETGGAE